MRVCRRLDELPAAGASLWIAVGVFDGIHLGHQRVIELARTAAHRDGDTAMVLTFDPHPLRVLRPDRAPLLLTSTAHKLRLFESLGVDLCLVLTFDRELAQLPAAEFVRRLVTVPGCPVRGICVGDRFRFGHDRLGDVALLREMAAVEGFQLQAVPSVRVGKEVVSSTVVRQHVLHGHLAQAAAMLGRRFAVLGTVVPGRQVGATLGFATANLDVHEEQLLPAGVYAAWARLDGRPHAAVVNIGLRPTFDLPAPQRAVEAHLLDFTGSLYNRDLELEFVQLLRQEQKFPSPAALREQIAADVAAARQLLAADRC
jgi:riboflavin kinase/FMN adenylyltransferase